MIRPPTVRQWATLPRSEMKKAPASKGRGFLNPISEKTRNTRCYLQRGLAWVNLLSYRISVSVHAKNTEIIHVFRAKVRSIENKFLPDPFAPHNVVRLGDKFVVTALRDT